MHRHLLLAAVACLPLLNASDAHAQQALTPVDTAAWSLPPLANLLPESKPIYDKAIAELKIAQTGLPPIRTAYANGKLAGLAPTTFTKMTSALTGLKRYARYLAEMGEPCGAEMVVRARRLEREFWVIANFYKGTQKCQIFNNKIRLKYDRNVKQREALYKKAMQLATAGKVEACEKLVLKTLQEWSLEISLSENRYPQGFAPALQIAEPAMTTRRRNEGAAALAKLRQSVLPNVDQTLNATKEIVDSVKASGTADISGNQADGPQAFDQISRYWKITHWNLHKAEAVEMARCGLAGRELPELAKIRAEHAKLTDGMAAALANLIVGDTNRATDELLDRYVKSAASLRVNSDAKTMSKVDQALGNMAVKLHGDTVGDLNVALNELLRWRGKSADARAAALTRSGFLDTQSSIIGAARSAKDLNGLLLRNTDEDLPRFVGCAAEIVTLAKAKGKKVSLQFAAPSTSTAQVRISRLHNRVYATLPPTWDSDASIAQLKADLLITEKLPPLTLTAAESVQSAESGAFRRVGATVKGVYPKSLIVEKFALPAVSWNMLPLGPMPAEEIKDFLPQAVIHVDVTPVWFQHEHFLAPAKTTGATAAAGG